jgi:hypothetical protein
MKVGIACSAGSYKGVFVHGVLAGFAETGLKAYMYATASSTAVTTAFAAIGELELLRGTMQWKKMYARYVQSNYDISKAIIDSLPEASRVLNEKLFKATAARYAVAVSAVITKEAAKLTQGPGARRLGQQLVLSIRTKDRSWAEKNLELHLFETGIGNARHNLTSQNLSEVLYATTRMLHAWKIPAWIEGLPYIDASYTCVCPAVELAQRGCDSVIAISPEAGQLYKDFFQAEVLPSSWRSIPIYTVQPPLNLSEIGVDYMKVTDDGLDRAYELGRKIGTEFLKSEKTLSTG